MVLAAEQLLLLQSKVDDIVTKAGEYALLKWKDAKPLQKGDGGDVVTEVDSYIESQIKNELTGLVDGAQIVGEENGGESGADFVWVIDPIDGTKHYAHLMPSYFVQVSLLYLNNPILGVIYDPVAGQLFSASSGNGAFINGVRAGEIRGEVLEKSILDIDFGGIELLEWKSKVFQELARKVYRVRVSAGRFAVYLLTGGINAFVVINPTTKLWDQAPRIILFQEAGLEVEQFEVAGHKVILASKGELYLKIKEIIINTVV